jgi:GntR family transcriptional regulator, galactonate operon transcriptional repressor
MIDRLHIQVDELTEEIQALEQEVAFSEMCAAEGRNGETLESDIRSHKLIISATQNKRLGSILATLDDQMYRIRKILPRSAAFLTETLREHRAIVEQIKVRDADGAERAMEEQLGLTCERAVRLVLPLRRG